MGDLRSENGKKMERKRMEVFPAGKKKRGEARAGIIGRGAGRERRG